MTNETQKSRNWTIQGVFLVIICLTITEAAPKQEFEATPVDTEVNPQQTVKLTCKIRNRQSACHWLHNLKVRGQIDGKYEYVNTPTNGDCSITINNASLKYDDGNWQCQVAAVAVERENLLSNMVKLTVRNEPDPPIIEHGNKLYGNIRYNTGDNFVAEADKESKFSCISKNGNPPAILKWFIDSKEITSNSVQTNLTGETNKTFTSSSSLIYTFQKDDHNKRLKCVALHATYPTGSKDVIVSLNISYAPYVKLEGEPTADVAEGDQLTLKCIASANPPARIIWKKSGVPRYSNDEMLKFEKIQRADSGYYSCSAENSVGQSQEISLHLDVKFKPNVKRVSSSLTKVLYSHVSFECEAEGNPPPRYNWLQSIEEKANTWQHRGSNATLIIQNATYAYQGKYICEVSNIIAGQEYKALSTEIELDIVGPPQYLRENAKNNEEVVVERDEDAIIGVTFCSDPPPKEIHWEWGSVKINVDTSLARYVSKPLIREELPSDCFEARLIIQNAESSDARRYTLYVNNEKGESSFDVSLRVKEPVTMSAVIGIVVGCIVVVVIVFLVVIYLLKKERCFIRRHGFHPESENSSQRLSDELQNNGRSSSKDRAIPPDALYTDVQAIRHYENPDAAKRSPDGIVYADLDLPALKSEKPKLHKSHEKIEYAEIQFKPNDKKDDEL